jgi:hypothetical protein
MRVPCSVFGKVNICAWSRQCNLTRRGRAPSSCNSRRALSHSVLASSDLRVNKGLKAVTVICRGRVGLARNKEGRGTDLMTRIAGIDGQSDDWSRSLVNPGKDW